MGIKYEDVKRAVEENGWQLLSDTYVNLKTNLEIQCPEGHINYVPFQKIRNGSYECLICKQNQYYSQLNNNIPVKKKGFRILAFDQASITSGWSVFDGQELVSFGNWTSEGNSSTERVAKTKYWFTSMIRNWKPDKVVLEDIQLQKGKDNEELVVTYKKLAQLQGVLINYLYENKIDYNVIAPSTWRAHSLIKGKTRADKKKSAQLKVKEKYDITVSIDTAEAILIGTYSAYSQSKNEMIDF